MKTFSKLTEKVVVDNGLLTSEVWVVWNNSTDISKIYLNKSDAEKIAEEESNEYYNHYRKVHKNMSDDEFEEYFGTAHRYNKSVVKSLYDAIDLIKEQIRDDYASHGDEGY